MTSIFSFSWGCLANKCRTQLICRLIQRAVTCTNKCLGLSLVSSVSPLVFEPCNAEIYPPTTNERLRARRPRAPPARIPLGGATTHTSHAFLPPSESHHPGSQVSHAEAVVYIVTGSTTLARIQGHPSSLRRSSQHEDRRNRRSFICPKPPSAPRTSALARVHAATRTSKKL